MKRKRWSRRLSVPAAFLLALLAAPPARAGAVPFGAQQPIPPLADGAWSVFAADVDGDGDLDVLSASALDDRVVWYENTDGAGAFGSHHPITDQAAGARSVFAADLDGDGDIDALSASYDDDKIAWYENDGAGGFAGGERVISLAADGARSVFAADVDGDGDLDVLSASEEDGKIAWYENDGAGGFAGGERLIYEAEAAAAVFAADVDGDGDLDALSASQADDKIAWYENDGHGGFGGEEHVISLEADGAVAVFARDLDGDGDPDVLAACRNMGWFENTGEAGTASRFEPRPLSAVQIEDGHSVYAADLDGDGDPDLLSASRSGNTIAWYENRDPRRCAPHCDQAVRFASRRVITTLVDGPLSVFPADVDGDGDLDVLSASFDDDTIAWYENQTTHPTIHRSAAFAPRRWITALALGFPWEAFPADVDDDGDQDLLTASSWDDTIAVFENTDGAGTFGSQRLLTTLADGARSVFAADLDGDTDLDALSASTLDNSIGWYRNDGAGEFGDRQLISDQARRAQSVFAADLDGDADPDVLSASADDGKIAWYENDGAGGFGGQRLISNQARGACSVFAADLDGDTDPDVLSASTDDDKIAWYENDGAGGFGGAEHEISTEADGAVAVFAIDLNGDQVADVLSASFYDGKIAWYENDGAGGFGGQVVIDTLADHARSVSARDLDGDGDNDVLAASDHPGHVVWYENTGQPAPADRFGPRQVIVTPEHGAVWVVATDVDGDQDQDVVSVAGITGRIAWYENDGTGGFDGEQNVVTPTADGALSAVAADVDGDGDPDVLSASADDDRIAWYESAGAGAFGFQVIDAEADGAVSVFAADVDGDGDPDAMSASYEDGKIAWYENDGAGNFVRKVEIRSGAGGAWSVFAADLDGDGDLDALSGTDEIAWYENDGAGNFLDEHAIPCQLQAQRMVSAADVDGDGDLDALSTTDTAPSLGGRSKILWYENDGAGNFSSEREIPTQFGQACSVFAADVDGDGDLDALSGSDKVAWHENDGTGSFVDEHPITDQAWRPRSVAAADLDGDGDVDVLSASDLAGRIEWYENDGAGNFGELRVITFRAPGARRVSAADLDGDGDTDVLSVSHNTVAWHENRGGQFALATTDVAQAVVADGQVEDLLAIEVTHRGRAGDSPLELATLELRLTDGDGAALTEAQARGLFETVRVYLDDGSGVLDGADTLVVSTSDLSSIASHGDGVLTVPFVDGDPDVTVEFGTPRTYLVAVEMTADAGAQNPSAFAFEHRTESSSTAEHAGTDIVLTLEYVADFQGGKVDTALSSDSCKAPLDLNLESRTVDSTVVCEAGTVLTAGAGLTVVSPGDLTLRAGQTVRLGGGFGVDSGGFAAEIDPPLEPSEKGDSGAGPAEIPCPPGKTGFYGRCVGPFGLFGQKSFRESSRNTVTGHAAYHAVGVVVDTSLTPNAVYVVDTGNNRILGFRHLGSCAGSGEACTIDRDCEASCPEGTECRCRIDRLRDADLIFGQPDAESAACNHDNNLGLYGPPGADTLCLTYFPIGNNVAEQWAKFNADVDPEGNLYVPDLYNNRILRYNAPFARVRSGGRGDTTADAVWGQPDLTTNGVNHGLGPEERDARSLYLHKAPTATKGSVTFAPAVGDDPPAIWVADGRNRRVLRFPLADSAVPFGTADLVLGQTDFTSYDGTHCGRPGASGPTAWDLDKLCHPSLARLDPETGELWVIDETDQPGLGRPFAARIVVFEPPFSNGMEASRQVQPRIEGAVPCFPDEEYYLEATALQFNTLRVEPYADGVVWVTEHRARRSLLLDRDGEVVAVIGARGPNECGGDSQYGGACGSLHTHPSLAVPGGRLGFDSGNNVYLADDLFHQVVRHRMPYELREADGSVCLPPPDANILRGSLEPNDVGPGKLSEVVGVTTFGSQLILHDLARYMVWEEYWEKPAGAPADVIVGDRDGNPFGIMHRSFLAVDGRDRLWAGKEHGLVHVFQLPLNDHSEPIAEDLLYVWDDDSQPVNKPPRRPPWTISLAFDERSNKLWMVDTHHHRLLRIANWDEVESGEPLRVDMVLGQGDKGAVECNRGLGRDHPDALGFCLPVLARFDRLGNLYVVENTYECHGNNRITVFDQEDLATAVGLFPDIPAQRVFNSFFSDSFTGPHGCGGSFLDRPHSPVTVAFNSRNEMVIGKDGYYPDDAKRAWRLLYYYLDPVASQIPDAAIRLPMGSVGDVHFDAEDRLVVQDHTWPRVWVIDLDERDPTGRRVWLEFLRNPP